MAAASPSRSGSARREGPAAGPYDRVFPAEAPQRRTDGESRGERHRHDGRAAPRSEAAPSSARGTAAPRSRAQRGTWIPGRNGAAPHRAAPTAGIHAAAAMARPELLRPRNVRSHRRTGTGAERPRATAPPPGGGRCRASRCADGSAPRFAVRSALPISVPAPSDGLRQRSGPGSEECYSAGVCVTAAVRVTDTSVPVTDSRCRARPRKGAVGLRPTPRHGCACAIFSTE